MQTKSPGMMIPSVDDYPFDPKKLVRLADGFDGVAVEMDRHKLKIHFVEGELCRRFGHSLHDGQAEGDAQGHQSWMGGGQAMPSDIAF